MVTWKLRLFSFLQLFDCQVKPMLIYASEIWGTTNIHVIETAHLFACKRLLNVSDKTPNNMIYGETGRYPLLIDSTIRPLRYWLKITNMPLNRFPRQAYTMLRNDVETAIQNNQPTGLHNWAKGIKKCLEAYGFHDVWLNGRVVDKSAFLSSFKNRMIGRFRGDLYSKISTSVRFSTYQVFKVTHQKEKYLDSITIKKFRDALIKLLLGICEIGVNKRHHPTNTASQNCPFCRNNLENEYHFLFKCPLYSDIRLKYIPTLTGGLSLKSVLTDHTSDNMRHIAMCIFYALKRREEVITS